MGTDLTNQSYWETQRQVADPLADAAIVSALTDTTVSIRDVMGHLMHNNSIPREKLPPALQTFLRDSSEMPPWFDPGKIHSAQLLFEEYGVEMCFVLLCKSLPECYCCWRGAVVLHETGRLTTHVGYKPYTRRVMESLQFAMNMLDHGGFDPEGRAVDTAQKVRLIHASIRYYMGMQLPDWDTAGLGIPINQEDLAFTLTTFSVSVLKGLEILGIQLTPEQQEGFTHLWAVVGYILGITEEHIPHTYAESVALQDLLMADQGKYSDIGAELTRALTDFIGDIAPHGLVDKALVHSINHFLGPERSAMIGVSTAESAVLEFIESCVRLGISVEEHMFSRNLVMADIIRHCTDLVVKGVILHFNHDKAVGFSIPASLTIRDRNSKEDGPDEHAPDRIAKERKSKPETLWGRVWRTIKKILGLR